MSHGNQERKMETGEVVREEESRGAQKIGKQYRKMVAEKGRHKEEIINTDFETCRTKRT